MRDAMRVLVLVALIRVFIGARIARLWYVLQVRKSFCAWRRRRFRGLSRRALRSATTWGSRDRLAAR